MAWTLRAKTIVQTRLPFGRRSARRSPSNPLAHGATERGEGTADRAGLETIASKLMEGQCNCLA
jgi:hypothetical protein